MVFGIHLGSWVLLGWRVLVPVLLPSSPSTTQRRAILGRHATPAPRGEPVPPAPLTGTHGGGV